LTIQEAINLSYNSQLYFTRQDFIDRGDKTIFWTGVDSNYDMHSMSETLWCKLPGEYEEVDAYPLFSNSWILASDWLIVDENCKKVEK